MFNVSNSISGSDGVLNFENSVMSPVFKFYPKNDDIIISEEYNYQNLKSQYQDITIMLTERMKVILR